MFKTFRTKAREELGQKVIAMGSQLSTLKYHNGEISVTIKRRILTFKEDELKENDLHLCLLSPKTCS